MPYVEQLCFRDGEDIVVKLFVARDEPPVNPSTQLNMQLCAMIWTVLFCSETFNQVPQSMLAT